MQSSKVKRRLRGEAAVHALHRGDLQPGKHKEARRHTGVRGASTAMALPVQGINAVAGKSNPPPCPPRPSNRPPNAHPCALKPNPKHLSLPCHYNPHDHSLVLLLAPSSSPQRSCLCPTTQLRKPHSCPVTEPPHYPSPCPPPRPISEPPTLMLVPNCTTPKASLMPCGRTPQHPFP